jgi:hypothetical protein
VISDFPAVIGNLCSYGEHSTTPMPIHIKRRFRSVGIPQDERPYSSTRLLKAYSGGDTGDNFDLARRDSGSMCEQGRQTTVMFNGKKKQWELRERIPDLKLLSDQEKQKNKPPLSK